MTMNSKLMSNNNCRDLQLIQSLHMFMCNQWRPLKPHLPPPPLNSMPLHGRMPPPLRPFFPLLEQASHPCNNQNNAGFNKHINSKFCHLLIHSRHSFSLWTSLIFSCSSASLNILNLRMRKYRPYNSFRSADACNAIPFSLY